MNTDKIKDLIRDTGCGIRNTIFKGRPKRFLSIDFGQAVLKVAYMESKGGGFRLLNYDLKKISSAKEGKEEIVGFITNFIETNSILEKGVYLTISDVNSIVIKPLTLPVVPKEEVLEAAKWELKEEVSFDLENALFDWQVVKEYTDEEGSKKNQIVCVMAKREIINKYLSITSSCNLVPVRISSGPFNYAEVLRRQESETPQIQAVLDIGFKQSTLCVYKNERLQFIRTLPFSCDGITQSLTGVLISDKGRLQLSYEEAEDIKQTFGVPQDETLVLKNGIRAMQVISLMRPLLEGLARELNRSFDYFTSNFQEESPSALYITGGGANLKNLDGYLSKELNKDVSNLPIPGCIDMQIKEKESLEKHLNQMINCLAAVLAGPRAVNLLPPEVKAKKTEFIEKVSLRLVAIAVGAILLFSLFVVKLQIRDYRNRLENAKVHLQTLGEVRVLKQNIDVREDFLSTIRKGRVPVDGLLKLISTLIPENIVLDELALNQKAHNLTLRGAIFGAEQVADLALTEFMEDIEASSFFTEASLTSSEKVGKSRKFEIKCDLVY